MSKLEHAGLDNGRWVAIAGLICGLVQTATAEAASFRIIDGLNGKPFQTNGISGDGRFVVGSSEKGERWSIAGGAEDLGAGVPFAASYDGSALAGTSSAAAARWTKDDGWNKLGDLGQKNAGAAARAISADGSILAGYDWIDSDVQAGFRWTKDEGMTELGRGPDGGGSQAFGMTPDGSKIVGTVKTTIWHEPQADAFAWTDADKMKRLKHYKNNPTDIAYAISADGAIAVGTGSGIREEPGDAVRWVNGTPEVLVLPGKQNAGVAYDISADGAIIVGLSAAQERAFWWTKDGSRWLDDLLTTDYGLDLQGVKLDGTVYFSDDGRFIAGNGHTSSREAVGWYAAIPEPTSALILVAAIGAAAGWRRRR